MKFRWRGGSKGFIARNTARAITRQHYRKYGGSDSTLPILFLFALIALGVFPLIVVLIKLLQVLLPILIIVGIGYFLVKKHYIQPAISWFFLKKIEADGTVLPNREIVNRTFTTIGQASKVEKAILASFAIIAVLVCEILVIAIVVRLLSLMAA